MDQELMRNAEKLKKRYRRNRFWKKILSVLGCMVVFCTVYALILPAITIEQGEACGLTEHQHDETCYVQGETVIERIPVCSAERLGIHRHTEACYNDRNELVCGYADYVVHRHDASCYNEDGSLWCPLAEIEAHTHSDSCYAAAENSNTPVHVHTDACYTLQRGELICTEPESAGHIHGEGCFTEYTRLVCTLPEGEGHWHSEGCYDENGWLICGIPESEGHWHGEGCYETVRELTCQIPESAGHQHMDECYSWQNVLSCGIFSEPLEQTAPVERQLVCSRPEVILHRHTQECVDENGYLICGKIQVLEHVHDSSCFEEREIVGDPVLICGMTEHIHTEDCFEVPEKPETEEETEPEQGGEQGTGEESGQETEEDAEEESGEETDVETGENTEEDTEEDTEEEPGEAAEGETGENTEEDTEEESGEESDDETDEELSDEDQEEFGDEESGSDADVETEADWTATLPGTLTGHWSEDVIAVARSQVGYAESQENCVEDEDGITRGYTRYGEWYGDPYGDWCAMFVSFCLHYAHVEGIPLEANCEAWTENLSVLGRYAAQSEYTPRMGDLIFLDWDFDGVSEHVGLVEGLQGDTVYTIEGNIADQVVQMEYTLTNPAILGYGILPSNEKMPVTRTAVIYTDESYQTISDDSTVITVTGLIPDEAEVRAFPVEFPEEENVLCAYDISIIMPDGTQFQPEEGETLQVEIQSEALNREELDEGCYPAVYHVPEDGEPENLETLMLPEGVGFEVEHFSVYKVLAVRYNQVTTFEQLKTAITNGESNIQLAANITASETLTIPSSKDINLDLNGYVLTASAHGTLFTIPTGAVLTIEDSQQKAEAVATASGSLAGNTAGLLDSTLTYYVTTTSVANSATGATQETLEKHTVSTAGSIVGGSQPVFQVTGGTLNIQSGMIRGGTGRAIVQTGGTTNLSGGYICGFTQSSVNKDNTSFGGAVRSSDGELNLSGSVLAGNTAHNGGAIYATGSAKLSITGGVISGNTANRTTSGWNDHSESGAYRCGGGGIYADVNAVITMSGGYITNNIATHDGYFDGGGGVCLSGTSSMALSGGYVTGNKAQGGGGIRTDFGKATTFVMTGGFVSANVATLAEGGGIAIDRNGVGTVTGGYITNNKIPSTGHWGGGGLFCADGSTLNLKNTLITENTAGGFGAGVAGCPTGNLYLYVTEGCAIYDNKDTVDGDGPHFTTDGVKQIDREICTEIFQSNGHTDFFCALNSTVTGTMLGNNAANWQGSADYQPVIADAEDLLSATRVMGLQAYPTEAGKSAAQSAAKVYINGNYSYTHGGGIMCNGNLVIGVPVDIEVPARVELQATKKLVDGSGNSQSLEDNDFSFKVTMTEPDGTVIASGTCDSSGKITFDHQLTFKQAGTFVYYIYEEANEENLSVTYDSTLYRLTVTVTKDNGVAWYGDTTKYTYSVASVKVESSTDGKTWTQISQNDTSQSGVISLPLTSGTTFTNHLIEPTKVTVQKKWEGGTGADSVTVILKQDGEEFKRQTLNAGNNWTYTWDDLEPGHTYTVEEVPVDGYTASYEIITSTDDSGSASLGQGSWWVPATNLTAGQQYLIVSPDGSKALYISDKHENYGFDTSDAVNVSMQIGNLSINAQTYSTWYVDTGIDARCIFTANTRVKNGYSGTILKCNGTTKDTWVLVQSANGNHLKSTSQDIYASNMVFENGVLKGHENYDWNPTDLRTVIYADGKFNTTTEQSPANAAKLYTLVSGEGFTGATIDSITVMITNTKEKTNDYELPETGGTGTDLYTIGGWMLTAGACFLLMYNYIK